MGEKNDLVALMSRNAHNSNLVNFTLHTNICNSHMTLYLTELLTSNCWNTRLRGNFDGVKASILAPWPDSGVKIVGTGPS